MALYNLALASAVPVRREGVATLPSFDRCLTQDILEALDAVIRDGCDTKAIQITVHVDGVACDDLSSRPLSTI